MRKLVALAVFLAVAARARPEVRPVYDTGAAGLLQLLERLPTTASVLHTGAHPDDEDSALIARLARGDHARVAYLSLNRGEGGQNVIGAEQGEALGVVRTEELLQARRLDGGEQLFTRVFDFGFSKSREEAARKWSETAALADFVRAIRLHRPLVMVSRWTGTPIDGHGQHQLAGHLAPQAFRVAGDPAAFPEQLAEGLRPWAPLKFYVSQPFLPDPTWKATLELDTGRFDPLLGRSYFEIAMEGRSQHKSQEQGTLELRGPQRSALRLVESRVKTPPVESSVFDGIDTSLPGLATLAGLPSPPPEGLARLQDALRRARGALVPEDPTRCLSALAEGLRAVRALRTELPSGEADFLLSIKERDLEEALRRAAGIVVDALADSETVAAGESVGIVTRVFASDSSLVKVGTAELRAPAGWRVGPGKPFAAGGRRRPFTERATAESYFEMGVATDAPPTAPYWLATPRRNDAYTWPEGPNRNRPFGEPEVEAVVPLEIAGVSVTVRQPVEHRQADPSRGELRRNLQVVPPLTLALEPDLLVVPTSAVDRTRRLAVRLEKAARAPLEGRVRLELPAGWRSEPPEGEFRLTAAGERSAVSFTVRVPPGIKPGKYRIGARAESGGVWFDRAKRTIAYPHIETHRLYAPAESALLTLDLAVTPVRVGYVMGSGDLGPEAIRRMGLSVTPLDEDALSTSDFSRFDTIVVGIRTAQVRPDFLATHTRLLDFVRRGGTLVVQYQRPTYAEAKLPPFRTRICGRVTDEAAAVTLLEPSHPVFNVPNRIREADWEGWVQERSLEHFDDFDRHFVPLLESHDPGEGRNEGALVEARVGRGRYVYTAGSWFRQLPAGVPGAYRLFANLLSLGRPRADQPRSPRVSSSR